MTRSHARAARGHRACGTVPAGHWQRLTVLGALSRDGFLAAMSIVAATSAKVFLAFLHSVLLPVLQRVKPDAIVLIDNLSAHKGTEVAAAFAAARIPVRFLPRYSPDLSPIEPGWGKMKTIVRGKDPRSIDDLDRELGPALDTIASDDAAAWFSYCGYVIPN